MSNVEIQLSAGLSMDQSYQQIKSDIESIQKRLNAAGIRINLSAQVDTELKKSLEALGNSKEPAMIGKKLGSVMASNIINGFHIKSKDAQKQIKNYTNELYRMTVGEIKTGSYNPDFIDVYNKLGEAVKNNANMIQSRMGIYDNFYQYFKNIEKIKIPDIVRKDLGKDWNAMRMVSAKTFTTSKGGVELDSIYQELSDKFKEHFSGTSDQTEQFREIVAAVKAYQADIDRLEPVDLSKSIGFEEDMWSTLIANLGVLRSQIKEQIPQIEIEVEKSAENIKKSLLSIDTSFKGDNIEELTNDVKAYFNSVSELEEKDIQFKFFKNANEEITSFHTVIDRGMGILEKYSFSLNEFGKFTYTGGSIIDKSGDALENLECHLRKLPEEIDYLETKFQNIKIKLPSDISESFQTMRDLIGQMNHTDDPKEKVTLYSQLSEQLDQVTRKYRQINAEQKNVTDNNKLKSMKELLSINIDTWMNKNTSAAKVFSERIDEIKLKLISADEVELDKLEREFKAIEAEAKQMGLAGSKAVQAMKSEVDSAITSVLSLTAAIQAFKQMVGTARDLDTSLFNLQVATGQTRQETKELLDSYNQMAKKLGATTSQIAEGADAWLRQGKSIEEANTLIRDSLILSKIGMIDEAEATEDLTAILNSYKLEAESALEIVSKLSSVDLESASDAGGLAESMSKTATSANQAGVSIDELIGILATLKDVTQASDEEIGNAVKSIVSRFTQIKANKFTDYETGEDLSNVESVLGKIGVKIRDSLTDYRELSDVLEDVAAKYHTLNDVERNAVNTALFGTYQANKGAVLLENWDKVKQLIAVSANATTEAMEKFEAYTDTLEAHINSMTASYEHLASVIADSEFLKGATDTASDFLDIISTLIDKLGVLSTATGAITGGAALKGVTLGAFDHNGTDITFLGKTAEEMKAATAAGEAFGGVFTKHVKEPIFNAQSVIDNYNKLVQEQCVSQSAINNLTDDFDMRNYLTGLKGAEAGMKGYTAAINMTEAATMKLKIQTVALNMAMNMALTAGITAGFLALEKACEYAVTAYDRQVNKIKYLKEEIAELQEEVSKAASNMDDYRSQLESINQQISDIKSLGTLTLSDQEDLERLSVQKDELENLYKIEKARHDLKQQELETTANEYLNEKVTSKYRTEGTEVASVTGTEAIYQFAKVTKLEELQAATEEMLRQQEILEELNKEYNRLKNPTEDQTSEYQSKKEEAETARDAAKQDAFDIQKEITDQVKGLDTTSQAYQTVMKAAEGLSDALANMDDDFEALSESGKKEKLISWIPDENKSKKVLAKFMDSLSEDELLDIKGQIKFDENTSLEEVKKIIKNAQESIDTTPITKSEMISDINEMSEGFEELDKIYKSISDNDPFDFSLLDDKNFKETFSGFTKEYENFVDVISNNPNDISKCRDTFNSLVGVWLQSKGILDNVTEETASLTEAMLQNMGIANASELVSQALENEALATAVAQDEQAASTNALAMEQLYATETGYDLMSSSWSVVEAFANEQNASELTKQALARLKIEQLDLSSNPINLDTNISQLLTMAKAAGIAANKLNILKEIEYWQGVNGSYAEDRYNFLANQLNSTDGLWATEYETNFKPVEYSSIKYTGGNKSNKSSSSKDKKVNEKEKETFNWMERMLEVIENRHEKISSIISDETQSITAQLGEIENLIALDEQKKTLLEQQVEEYRRYWLQTLEEINEEQLKIYGGGMTKSALIKKITEGDVKIQDFVLPEGSSDEQKKAFKELIECIKNIQAAYLDIEDTEKKIDDTEEDIRKNQKERHEKRIAEIEAENDTLAAKADIVKAEMELLEASGGIVTVGMYENLIENSKQQMQVYEKQMDELQRRIDEVSPNSTEWYQLKAQISDCEQAIIDCKTAQEEWNYKIKRLPIERLQIFLDMLENIKQDLENFNAEQSKFGLNPNKEQYQQLIDISEEQIESLLKQQSKLKDLLGDYQYGSTKYTEISEELQDIDNQISSLIQDQIEYNEAILQIPITEMERQYSNLTSAKTALENAIAEDNANGLSTTISQYTELNKLTVQQLQALETRRKALTELLDVYDKDSDKYYDTLDAINGINDEMSQLVQNQYQWNQEILNMPIEKLEKVNDNLSSYSSILGDVLSDYDSALEGINALVDAQIDGIQNELDILQQSNEARKIQLSLEQAQYDLERARNQKTTQVIRNGEKVWEADQDSIRDAEQNLADAQYEKMTYELEQQIEALEKIKEKWAEIVEKIQEAQDIQNAENLFGSTPNWKDLILSGDDQSLRDMFKDLYESTSNQKDAVDDEIASNERLTQMMNEIVSRYQDGSLTYEQAISNINSMISAMEGSYSSMENLEGMMGLDNIQNLKDIASSAQGDIDQSAELLKQYMQIVEANKESVKNFETSLDNVPASVTASLEALNKAADSMTEYLDAFNKNAEAISKNTSTWEEMKKNIEDQIEALKKAAEALEKAQSKKTYSSSGGSGGGGSSSSSGGSSIWAGGSAHSDKEGSAADIINKYGTSSEKDKYWSYREDQINKKADKTGDEGWREAALKDLANEKSKYHVGGIVGEKPGFGNKEFEEILKHAKVIHDYDYLKNGEVQAILQKGEIVTQPAQMAHVIENSKRIGQIEALSAKAMENRQAMMQSIDCSIGEIHLHEVQNVDGLAKALDQSFVMRIGQKYSKYF